MIRGHHLLPFTIFFLPRFLPSGIVLGAASPGKASSNGEDYIATIIEPECSLRPQLRTTFLLHLPGPRLTQECFLRDGLLCCTLVQLSFLTPSPAPQTDHQWGAPLRCAADLFLRFPRFRLEMPIMSYQDGGSIKY